MNEEEMGKLQEIMLYVEEKCNFRCKKHPELKECEECEENKDCSREYITWDCNNDQTFLNEALKKFKIEPKLQEKFREYLMENGGFCDCEIVFNVLRE